MNAVKVDIPIENSMLVDKTAEQMEGYMKQHISDELLKVVQAEVENGNYMTIEPTATGYHVQFEMVMCERAKLDEAIGKIALALSNEGYSVNGISKLLSPLNALFGLVETGQADDSFWECPECGEPDNEGAECDNCGYEREIL